MLQRVPRGRAILVIYLSLSGASSASASGHPASLVALTRARMELHGCCTVPHAHDRGVLIANHGARAVPQTGALPRTPWASSSARGGDSVGGVFGLVPILGRVST